MFDVSIKPVLFLPGGDELFFTGDQLSVDLRQSHSGLHQLAGDGGRRGQVSNALFYQIWKNGKDQTVTTTAYYCILMNPCEVVAVFYDVTSLSVNLSQSALLIKNTRISFTCKAAA